MNRLARKKDNLEKNGKILLLLLRDYPKSAWKQTHLKALSPMIDHLQIYEKKRNIIIIICY